VHGARRDDEVEALLRQGDGSAAADATAGTGDESDARGARHYIIPAI
jgi:hypothetical protein